MLSRPYFKHSIFIPFFWIIFIFRMLECAISHVHSLFSMLYSSYKGESILQCQSALDSFCSLCRRGEDYQCHDDLLPTQVSSIRNLWKNMKNHCIIQYILCSTLYLYMCVCFRHSYTLHIFIQCSMFCDESKKRELEVVVL